MLILCALVVAGLVLLVVAGDLLVRGAVALSLRAGISALVVSLTVVAMGTSAPELFVAITAALEGSEELVLGNVVGSNIANVWLVLGVPALILAMVADGDDVRRSFAVMIAVTLLFIGMGFLGPYGFVQGLILLAVFAVVMADMIRCGIRSGEPADDMPDVSDQTSWGAISGYLLAGIIGLPLGAELLVNGATGIAREFGLSDAIVGLSIVAIGTSLPELATTVAAAMRRQTDVALGNVIGSNLFNILLIMGVAALFAPINVPERFLSFDFWAMLVASLSLVPFVIFGKKLGKVWGIGFLLIYTVYIVSLVSSHSGG